MYQGSCILINTFLPLQTTPIAPLPSPQTTVRWPRAPRGRPALHCRLLQTTFDICHRVHWPLSRVQQKQISTHGSAGDSSCQTHFLYWLVICTAIAWIYSSITWIYSSIAWIYYSIAWIYSSIAWIYSSIPWIYSSIAWIYSSIAWIYSYIAYIYPSMPGFNLPLPEYIISTHLY